MTEQRQRSKQDAAARKVGHADGGAYRSILDTHGTTEFLGYRDLTTEARVVGLLSHGRSAVSAGDGAEVEVVLDRTPFYAEGGGQLADTGKVVGDGVVVEVYDVQSPVAGLNVHRGQITNEPVAASLRSPCVSVDKALAA